MAGLQTQLCLVPNLASKLYRVQSSVNDICLLHLVTLNSLSAGPHKVSHPGQMDINACCQCECSLGNGQDGDFPVPGMDPHLQPMERSSGDFWGQRQASQLQISLGWAQDSAGVAGHSSSPGCGRLSKSDRRAISEQAGGLSPVCPNMHPSDDCLAPESARTEPTRPPQPSGAPGRMDAGVDPVPRSHRSRSVPVP